MKPVKQETVPIANSADVVLARQKVRQWAMELKFTLVDQTKLVTAASELARNALEHGKGGHMVIEQVENSVKNGLKLVFEDQGPGIPDVEAALRDGFTTGGGLGRVMGADMMRGGAWVSIWGLFSSLRGMLLPASGRVRMVSMMGRVRMS